MYYVPTDNERLVSKLRLPLTREEIDAAIDSVKDAPVQWIDDRTERQKQCHAALHESDVRQILLIVGMLYLHKQNLSEENKRLSSTDETILRDAEKLLPDTVRAFRIFSLTYLFAGIAVFGSAFFTALNNGLISALISFLRTFVNNSTEFFPADEKAP